MTAISLYIGITLQEDTSTEDSSAAVVELGADCGVNDQCPTGAECRYQNGRTRCLNIVQQGERCATNNTICDLGLTCLDDFCEPSLGAFNSGFACTNSSQCRPWLDCTTACSDPNSRCTDNQSLGYNTCSFGPGDISISCTSDVDCPTGTVCDDRYRRGFACHTAEELEVEDFTCENVILDIEVYTRDLIYGNYIPGTSTSVEFDGRWASVACGTPIIPSGWYATVIPGNVAASDVRTNPNFNPTNSRNPATVRNGDVTAVCYTNDTTKEPCVVYFSDTQADNGCSSNSECPSGQVCLERTFLCSTPSEVGEYCDENADCQAGSCNTTTNTCADSSNTCTSSSTCGTGEACISGSCTPTNSCSNDSQCTDTAQSCINGSCQNLNISGGACDTENDCVIQLTCQNGTCVPPLVQCSTNSQCTSGEVCINGNCSTSNVCNNDSQCFDAGQSCISGSCQNVGISGSQCDSDPDCSGSLTCQSGVCTAPVTSCSSNAQCSGSEICINSVCTTTNSCTTDFQCNDPAQSCINGSCQATNGQGGQCNTDGDCTGTLVCTNGTCATPVSSCTSNTGCAAGQTCISNICTTTNSCTSDAFCTDPGQSCISGSCQNTNGVGGICNSDPDCTGSLVCENGLCDDPTTGEIGSSCTANANCDTGLVCINNQCSATNNEGGLCDEDDDCTGALVCESGTCDNTSTGELGQSCSTNTNCDAGLVCVNNQCANQSGSGGACDENDDCQAGLECDIGGTNQCQTPTSGNIGESCTVNGDCISGLVCVGTPSTCQNPSSSGGTCDQDEDCQSGLECNLTTNQCVSNGNLGSTCSVNGDCDSGLVCVTGTCSEEGAIGRTCDEDGDCQTGLICTSGTCSSSGALGSTCAANTDCDAGLVCISNQCTNVSSSGGACDQDEDCLSGLTCSSGICTSTTSGTGGTVVSGDLPNTSVFDDDSAMVITGGVLVGLGIVTAVFVVRRDKIKDE